MRLRGVDHDYDVALLRRAVSAGVDHIDTARMYANGKNEELIADALFPYPDELLIASKGGIETDGDTYRNDARPLTLRRHVEQTLRRLRVERIGLYYLHEPDPNVALVESIATLAQLQHEGKIAMIGLSNVTAAQLVDARTVAAIAAVQNRYSASQPGDEGVRLLTEKHGIAFVPWGPLRDNSVHAPPPLGSTPAQHALRALLELGPNVLPIPGTSSLAHLDENLATLRQLP